MYTNCQNKIVRNGGRHNPNLSYDYSRILLTELYLQLFYQLKNQPLKDALLSDIAIGTSAAPTFFPAHYFETKDDEGNTRTFNLVDGGVAANNPVGNLLIEALQH